MKCIAPFRLRILTLFFVLGSLSVHASIFIPLQYEQARQLAKKENKMLMLKFGANWCLPCKFMDKSVFADKAIYEYMSQRVIAVQIDIDQLSGKDLKEKFKVKKVPTIVFINPNGNEIARRESSMTATDFLQWIENLAEVHHIPASAPSNLISLPSYEPLHNDKIESSKDTEVVIDGQSYNTNMENPKAVANQAKNTILFGQFYVQLGAFHEMENALKKAQELDDQFSQNASVLEDNEPTGQPMFKLNLGPFDSEEEADLFVQVLRDRNIEALVKKSQF